MIYIDKRFECENLNDYDKLIEKVIDLSLEDEKIDFEYEISVVLTNNNDIRGINKDTRNIDSATDVLSFPMIEYPEKSVFKDVYLEHDFDDSYFDGDSMVLGDIVLSVERCKEQAIEYNHPFERELSYLLVHSVLHLLGYDHMEEDDKRKMRAREEEILSEMGICR